MGDALMNWEEEPKRWRRMYRGKRLYRKASALGGTNCTDTKLAANQWFREQKEKIDRAKAVQTSRPHELEYLTELEGIESAIKSLTLAMRANADTKSMLAPTIDILKQRAASIKQALQKKTLPPLDDRLRNPLNLSPESYEKEGLQEATRHIADRLREQNIAWVSDDEIDDTYNNDGMETLVQRSRWNGYAQRIVEGAIEKRIQDEAAWLSNLPRELIDHKKQEVGAIGEYERGDINRIAKEYGASVPESKKLEYHIDKFIECQKRKEKLGDISAGRLDKIVYTIEFYRKWSPIINGNVEKIGKKEHIDKYYAYLSDKVIAKEYKPRYVKNLFADFKMLIGWLFEEEVLKEYPRCLQIKTKRYSFRIEQTTPKVVPLTWVHKILDAADPRMKLFLLLTLNTGAGASEIGQMTKAEYNPKEGRIKHKRHKTKDSPNVPTVCYKLWAVTQELLDNEIAKRKNYPKCEESAKYLLVNSNGKPLWSQHLRQDGKVTKNDNITSAFKRLIAKLRKSDPDFPLVSYYQFRKTSASIIRNSHQFRTYNGLWLGHAPQTVGDQHYNAMDDTVLDECIAWLHDKIFGSQALSEEEQC